MIPPRRLEAATVGRYTAQPVPRAMLSGLILRDGDKPGRTVKDLFFTAIAAPATDVASECGRAGARPSNAATTDSSRPRAAG